MWFYADNKNSQVGGSPAAGKLSPKLVVKSGKLPVVSPGKLGSPKGPIVIIPPKMPSSPSCPKCPACPSSITASPKGKWPMMGRTSPPPRIMVPRGNTPSPKGKWPMMGRTSPPPRIMVPRGTTPSVMGRSPPVIMRPIPIPGKKKPWSPMGGKCNKSVSVPNIKYVLNQHPMLMEKIRKKKGFNQVPVSYEFEKRQFPLKVIKGRSPCSGRKGGRGSPWWAVQKRSRGRRGGGSPCGSSKPHLPCGMQTPWHMNRSPCKQTCQSKTTGVMPASPCSGRSTCGITFPRWKSQYVPQSASPCFVKTTSCGTKTRCGTC